MSRFIIHSNTLNDYKVMCLSVNNITQSLTIFGCTEIAAECSVFVCV